MLCQRCFWLDCVKDVSCWTRILFILCSLQGVETSCCLCLRAFLKLIIFNPFSPFWWHLVLEIYGHLVAADVSAECLS